MSIIDVAIKAVIGIAWLVFCLWTIWKLNELRKKDNLTYRHGIAGYGVMLWAGCIVVGAVMTREVNSRHSLWYYGFVFAFEFLPICLWGGYVWGKVMASLFPRQ